MIKKLLKFAVGIIALFWIAKKMHHRRHEARKTEPLARRLGDYLKK